MTAPLDRDKLRKVLALLTSNHDGEVIAAARAAVRMLASAGLRPADLADGLPIEYWAVRRWNAAPRTREAAPEAPPAETDAPAPPPPPRKPAQSFRDLRPSMARLVLSEILTQDLAPADREFIAGLAEQLRTAPHRWLSTAEVRRANRLWRTTAGGAA